jgi:hypothetical protein
MRCRRSGIVDTVAIACCDGRLQPYPHSAQGAPKVRGPQSLNRL